MAGIGFELRKAISSNTSSNRAKGYLGAAFSSSGSMIVAIVLFCLIQWAARIKNVDQVTSDSFMCYVTTAMFVSMIVVSVFSLVLSRYISNVIYSNNTEKVMPSLIGGTLLVSIIGGVLFSAMMLFSKISLEIFVSLLALFLILNICWLLMTYISLLRDYKQVVIAYGAAFIFALIALVLFFASGEITIPKMILVLTIAFGIVDIVLFRAVYFQFSKQDGSVFEFINEFRNNIPLVLIGIFMMLGMLGHFGVVWYLSSVGIKIGTAFRFSSTYDFPAIVAYFSTIPSAIYFVTLFETSFSESYQSYFYKLGNGGTVEEINQSKSRMINTISNGIKRITTIQFVFCLLFITVGAKLLGVLNIGMTESMIHSFRMFCVGYSLYYIGNIFILIQLYFTNERKAVWTSAAFLIGSLVGTYLESKFLKNSWGIGFSLSSLILVVVSGVQLVRFLEDLEYNILCKSNYSHNDVHCNYMRNSNKKRLPIMIVSACMAFIITIGSGAWIIADKYKQNKIMTFTPVASEDVLLSPGMGLAPWAESDEALDLHTSLVYVELRWSDWEPEDDVFNVDFVKDYYNLDFYREDGRKIVFRFICDDPTEEEHLDIPEWLYHRIDEDGDWYNIEYGQGFSPNYSNEILITEHAEAVAALGKAFGQDDFFVYVELGSLGHWGEWHINYEAGLKRMPEFSTREEYIKPYIAAFPHAQFLIRYPLIDATKYQMGLYNDMTGDYDETTYWLEQMREGVWEQTELKEQSDCSNTWKTLPIGGEFASSYDNDYFMREEFDLTLEGIKSSHQSFIGPKIIIDESDEHYEHQMNEILKTIGYRYRVESLSIDFGNKESFDITCNLVNDGIAPIYLPYSIQLDIYDADGSVVWTSEDIELDLRTVLPGEKYSFTTNAEKEEFDDDMKYTLAISITDSDGIPAVPLALSNEMDKNIYNIAEFFIK